MATWLFKLHLHDERILHALILRRWKLGDSLMSSISHLGDAVTTVGVTVLLLSGLVPPLQPNGRFAAIALLSSHLCVQLLKRTINRPRPRLPVGYGSLAHPPDRFSFPSGHAASSLSVAIALALSAPALVAGPILIVAGLVGISRCYLGVHYPGDVLAGWVLGLMGASLAAFIV